MSRRSLRAAGGLRRPSESRAFLASRSTIYLDDACRFEPRPLDLRGGDYSMTRGRTGDPKTMGTIDRAKQHRAEAAPGPDGDDNGPGSEPPPHGRFRYVSTFVTSRRRSPAAVGKPSFTYFPVDCLPHDVWRPDEPTDLRDGDLPDATPCERSEDHGPNRRKPRIGAVGGTARKKKSHLLPARYLCWAPQRHLGGTSVGWPPVRVRICRSDNAAAGVTSYGRRDRKCVTWRENPSIEKVSLLYPCLAGLAACGPWGPSPLAGWPSPGPLHKTQRRPTEPKTPREIDAVVALTRPTSSAKQAPVRKTVREGESGEGETVPASVPEEERRSGERGSSNSDGSSRGLSPEGSSLKSVSMS
ncbi:hypothetical protein THAOC_12951, partial [Thalassiosira oceanica]